MKKSLALGVTALLIFGLMGFGFAMWADSVTVSAAVETGDVEIGIKDVGTNDNITTTDILGGTATNEDDGLPDNGLGEDPQADVEGVSNEEGKNVAQCISTNDETVKFNLGTDSAPDYYYGSIKEEIFNAYPYYEPTTQFEIASNGSIPVKIDAFNVVDTAEGGSDDLTDVTFSWVVTDTDGTTTYDGTGLDDLRDQLFGMQIHEGEKIVVDLTTSFGQDTPQDAYAAFEITVHACQWNEYGITPAGEWSDLPATEG